MEGLVVVKISAQYNRLWFGQIIGVRTTISCGAIHPCPDLDWIEPHEAGDVDRRKPLVTECVNVPFAAPEKTGNVGGGPEESLWLADVCGCAHMLSERCQLRGFPGEFKPPSEALEHRFFEEISPLGRAFRSIPATSLLIIFLHPNFEQNPI